MGLKSEAVGLFDFCLGIGTVTMNGKVEESSNRWSNCIYSHFSILPETPSGPVDLVASIDFNNSVTSSTVYTK